MYASDSDDYIMAYNDPLLELDVGDHDELKDRALRANIDRHPLGTISSPISEFLKTNIKETLEQNQKHRYPTVVDNTFTMQTRILDVDNVDAAGLLENFNKFDTVVDYSDHLFLEESSPETHQHPTDWVNKIKEDRRLLMEHLPDTIFVRVYESRMDILRAAIIGQKGTPYHDGLFFFDVWFPRYYPRDQPLVRYHSAVPGISPHLNRFGDVRLILFNEHCKLEYMWSRTSNMLQLLVLIRDLILNAKPYLNMIGNVTSTIDLMKERTSFLFNENIVVKSLITMIYTMNKPPENFEDLVLGHFRTRVHDILMACKAYIEGQKEVGCLVSGINHTPSIKFKKDLISCIKPLVKAFDKIGAKEAQQYLYLSEEKTVFPANAPNPVAVDERTSDSAKKGDKVDEDIVDAVNLKKVNEEINVAANEKWNEFVSYLFSLLCPRFTNVDEEFNPAEKRDTKVAVDEETDDDSTTKESKVPDTDIYPLRGGFTVRAFFDSVISKVPVHAGMTIEEGHPLYVMEPIKIQNLLDLYSLPLVKEFKAEYSMIKNILTENRSLGIGIFSMEDMPVDQEKEDADLNNNLMAGGLGNEDDDVLGKYENFKKFDYVTDIPDHFFSAQKSDVYQPSEEWANKIREEWAILEKQLPDTIYVRVEESRMDLLRAVIIGPQGTPYRDGLFFFDLCFPSNYPFSPPLVHYHSCGLCINPNLHKCGKVDLSLPKPTGGQETMWVPGTSTILNLLVSIQDQILTTNPIYNDLTYAIMRGSVYGKLASECYNENSILKSLKTMVQVMNRPPKNFEDFVVGHFRNRLRYVMGIFKMMVYSSMCYDDLALCKKLIIAAFNKIGAQVP